MIEQDDVAVLRRLQEARYRTSQRSDLEVISTYLPDAGQWIAAASRAGDAEYDTGSAKPADPAAAYATLAWELYREVIALRETLLGPEDVGR